MKTNLNQPLSARVYVNLLEGNLRIAYITLDNQSCLNWKMSENDNQALDFEDLNFRQTQSMEPPSWVL